MRKKLSLLLLLICSYHLIYPQTVKFEKRKKLPNDAHNMIASTDGERIFLVGGVTLHYFKINKTRYNNILIYNCKFDEWIDVSDTFDFFKYGGISSSTYLTEYGKLLITGNLMLQDTVKSISVYYDTKLLRTSDSFINPIDNLLQYTTYHNDKTYFFGGYRPKAKNSNEAFEASSSFYSLDPSKLSTDFLMDMPIKAATKGLVVNNRLFTIGGRYEARNTKAVYNDTMWDQNIYSYDFIKNKWELFLALDEQITLFSTATYKSYIFIIGYFNDQDQLMIIDTNTKKVRTLELDIDALSSATVVVGDYLHIMGGLASNGPTKKHYIIHCDELLKSLDGNQ